MSRLDDIRLRLKDLILSNCNTVGCSNCGNKWVDSDTGKGTCSQQMLMDELYLEETKNV